MIESNYSHLASLDLAKHLSPYTNNVGENDDDLAVSKGSQKSNASAATQAFSNLQTSSFSFSSSQLSLFQGNNSGENAAGQTGTAIQGTSFKFEFSATQSYYTSRLGNGHHIGLGVDKPLNLDTETQEKIDEAIADGPQDLSSIFSRLAEIFEELGLEGEKEKEALTYAAAQLLDKGAQRINQHQQQVQSFSFSFEVTYIEVNNLQGFKEGFSGFAKSVDQLDQEAAGKSEKELAQLDPFNQLISFLDRLSEALQAFTDQAEEESDANLSPLEEILEEVLDNAQSDDALDLPTIENANTGS